MAAELRLRGSRGQRPGRSWTSRSRPRARPPRGTAPPNTPRASGSPATTACCSGPGPTAAGPAASSERLQDVHGWRSELQRHVGRLLADTESLLALRQRLEKALDATEIPYAIAADNLSCRARRPGRDLVRDAVEDELLKVAAGFIYEFRLLGLARLCVKRESRLQDHCVQEKAKGQIQQIYSQDEVLKCLMLTILTN